MKAFLRGFGKGVAPGGFMWFLFWTSFVQVFLLKGLLSRDWLAVVLNSVSLLLFFIAWAVHIKMKERELWLSLTNLPKSSLYQNQSHWFRPHPQALLRQNPSALPSQFLSESGNPYPLRYQESPLLGFRWWRIPDVSVTSSASAERDVHAISTSLAISRSASLGLESITRRYFWTPGINVAKCIQSGLGVGTHWVPDPDCSCGFYGLSQILIPPDQLNQLDRPGGIFGVFIGWGIMVAHASGFRSQYARILAILDDRDGFAPLIAERYQVPVFKNLEGMIRYAHEYGESLQTTRV